MNLLYSGKVRDIYDAGDDRLLMVTSDRISAFDVVLDQPIPHKGRVLTLLTEFWADQMTDIVPNHLVSVDGSSMLVRKADMLPIECIVRGYLSGSAWKEYTERGTVHGTPLPPGLRQSQQLPDPIFTPSTKAAVGDHDENISFDQAADLVGEDVAAEAAAICLNVYHRAEAHAARAGIIIADTKFELGRIDGRLALCDEILTPDSSRFWEAAAWQPGTTPPSFDKQPVRDWLESTGWDKRPPAPPLPPDVVEATSERYVSAYERLTGKRFDRSADVAR
ncbi:MAG: phosphoribosylaminoimidazolesuccinocarboxamide synthase [Actinomycetota bacterium]|nr:phosphoribosylaminoimidazolesuccinocarboxamide synthase [Actinomycetota bacterium]